MASLRKAAAYSKKKVRPYTRKSKIRHKSYIKQIPHNKIVKYNMGNVRSHNDGKFKFCFKLVANEKVQIRDNSLEACRLVLNKGLERRIPGKFYFEVRVYPHHILRNNKTAAGAGADRLSSGMKHSFGVVEGRAAIVGKGKDVFFVSIENEIDIKHVREVMAMVKSKLPCKSKLLFEKKN